MYLFVFVCLFSLFYVLFYVVIVCLFVLSDIDDANVGTVA